MTVTFAVNTRFSRDTHTLMERLKLPSGGYSRCLYKMSIKFKLFNSLLSIPEMFIHNIFEEGETFTSEINIIFTNKVIITCHPFR